MNTTASEEFLLNKLELIENLINTILDKGAKNGSSYNAGFICGEHYLARQIKEILDKN